MSFMTLNFESEYLGNNHTVGVILPDKPRKLTPDQFYGGGKRYKVLWLLHGTFGDWSDWVRKSMIELYACERDLIVVMPSALNSNYANWPCFGTGFNMYDYFFRELMSLVYGWLPASDKREDNYIAGLSMGGRGVCVLALNHPEKFAGACALSAVPSDLRRMKAQGGPLWERMRKSAANFDSEEEFIDSYQNTYKVLTESAAGGVDLPKLIFGCGEDDMLYRDFLDFKGKAEALNIGAEFFSIPGYRHEWRFWDLGIQKALDLFGIPAAGSGNPF